ncbi:hypothetical protein LZ31DRAFT_163523 [Colletotrichum somersetense]|nr:hypothetical protein LZ31DRAFT_163523 [Colletotrichum somersetense]
MKTLIMSTNRDSRDSEGKYQDDCEDAMMNAGKASQERRQKAKEEQEKIAEEEKQVASKEAMMNAGKTSRERRKHN